MSNNMLFLVCTLIWGTTWIAITFQPGEMSLIYSVGFRFLIAAALLGLWCLIKKLPMGFSTTQHFRMLLAGFSLYTLDYIFLYLAQEHIVSALLAVLSVSVVYFNVVLRKVVFDKPVRPEVLFGACVSALGLWLLFGPKLANVGTNSLLHIGLMFAALSFFFAAVGNVLSENVMETGVPVIQFNFFAMSYGVLFTLGYAFFSGEVFEFPQASEYWLSLIYLSLFGSVLAFGAYMKLVKNIGADKAANVILAYPVVALLVSTLFEDYQWTLMALLGILIVLTGNAIAMDKITISDLSNLRQQVRHKLKGRA